MSKAVRRSVSPWLPEDMVAEILSRLPVESLLRFKCVCKEWHQLIHQDDFVEKHLRQGCYDKKSETYLLGFWCMDIQKGFMLERKDKGPTGIRHHLRNPATRQTVYLPDLRIRKSLATWAVARMFFVGKSINECTVISFSGSRRSKESALSGRFKAITVGVDAAWRPLKNSPPNSIYHIGKPGTITVVFALRIEKVFYVVTMDGTDRNILWVDAEEEMIRTLEIPDNLFSNWQDVTPGEWNSKLSLLCRDGDHQIKIQVLINNNKNEWFKTQTFDLATLTQCYPISIITVTRFYRRLKVGQEENWWWGHKSKYVPSILHLKGMQSQPKELDKPTMNNLGSGRYN